MKVRKFYYVCAMSYVKSYLSKSSDGRMYWERDKSHAMRFVSEKSAKEQRDDVKKNMPDVMKAFTGRVYVSYESSRNSTCDRPKLII